MKLSRNSARTKILKRNGADTKKEPPMSAKLWDEYTSFVNTYYAVQEHCEELRRNGNEAGEGLVAFCHDANPFLWDSHSSADPTVYGNFSSSFYVRFSNTMSTAEDALAFCRDWLDQFGSQRYAGELLDAFDSVVDSPQTWESAYAPITEQLDQRARMTEWLPQDDPSQHQQVQVQTANERAEGSPQATPASAAVENEATPSGTAVQQQAEAVAPEPAEPAPAPTPEAPTTVVGTTVAENQANASTSAPDAPHAPVAPPAPAASPAPVAPANTAQTKEEETPSVPVADVPPQQEPARQPYEMPLPQNVLRLNVHTHQPANPAAQPPQPAPQEAATTSAGHAAPTSSVPGSSDATLDGVPGNTGQDELTAGPVPTATGLTEQVGSSNTSVPPEGQAEKVRPNPSEATTFYENGAETFVAPGAPPEVSKASLSDTDAIASLLAMDDPLLARTLEEFFIRGMQCGTVVELVVRLEGTVVACAGLTFADLMPTAQNPSGVCAVVSGLAARYGYSEYLQLLLKAIEKKTLARGVGELTLLDSSARSVEACERYGFRLEGSRLVMHL